MTKLPQSKDDLLEHLKEQIGFLKKSCSLFDSGDITEAKRLGVTLRLLLHDTKNSHSLLSQLNKLKIRFYDTSSDYDPQNLVAHLGLVSLKFGLNPDNCKYEAKFLYKPVTKSRTILFDKWWNKIIIVDGKKNKFTRKSLILSITEKDGGAHIDPELEESYSELTRFHSVGWKFILNGTMYNYLDVELHSIRQIVEEVLETLKLNMPKLFK